jgi:hypothetical protein
MIFVAGFTEAFGAFMKAIGFFIFFLFLSSIAFV